LKNYINSIILVENRSKLFESRKTYVWIMTSHTDHPPW